MKVDLNASIGLKEVRELAVDFLSWWRKELGSLVPERFRRIADSSFARRTIRLEGDVWQVSKSGSEQEILTLDMSEPSDVLHQRIRRVDAACLANRLDAELPASCGLRRRSASSLPWSGCRSAVSLRSAPATSPTMPGSSGRPRAGRSMSRSESFRKKRSSASRPGWPPSASMSGRFG